MTGRIPRRARLAAALPVLLAAGLAACGGGAYRREVDEWHEKRLERLRSPEGWLSLVGLFRLEEGANTFGSAADNDFVFPEKAPAHAGVLRLEGGVVTVEPSGDAGITVDGKPVAPMPLASDTTGAPTVLEMGPLRFYVIARPSGLFVRLKDREAELISLFESIERYPVREKYRVAARFEPYEPSKMLTIPNIMGYESIEACPGALVFTLDGQAYRLEPTVSGDEFFVVFGDETSGVETYGGGRYLYTAMPDAEGRVILDFNRAYNPPCIFTHFATCALPHADNILPVRIEAGEKTWEGASH
ncbi:MAG: DUF1684 domain-containing protein [Candidatus Krumholzibacteria bacterium]|nr:DUF1684 domain-containing protein [Candidatus Krumholzibacteria bacterium]